MMAAGKLVTHIPGELRSELVDCLARALAERWRADNGPRQSNREALRLGGRVGLDPVDRREAGIDDQRQGTLAVTVRDGVTGTVQGRHRASKYSEGGSA